MANRLFMVFCHFYFLTDGALSVYGTKKLICGALEKIGSRAAPSRSRAAPDGSFRGVREKSKKSMPPVELTCTVRLGLAQVSTCSNQCLGSRSTLRGSYVTKGFQRGPEI